MKEKAAFFIVLAILTAGWWMSPAAVENVPLCWFHYFFHLDCPGCGLTRSFLSMARGDVLGAFRFNAAGPLIYLLFIAYAVRLFIRDFLHGKIWDWGSRFNRVYTWVVGGLLLGHWIYKLSYEMRVPFFY